MLLSIIKKKQKHYKSYSFMMSNISIRQGCRLANSSIAAAISTGMSRCTVKSVSPDSRCVVYWA